MAAKTRIEQIIRTPGGPRSISVLPDHEFLVNGTFIMVDYELPYVAGEVFIYEGNLEDGNESRDQNCIWLDDDGTTDLAGYYIEELYDSLSNEDKHRFSSELYSLLSETLTEASTYHYHNPSGKTKLHRDFAFTPLTLKA